MIVKITTSHSLGGGRDVEAGTIMDMDPQVAAVKFRQKYAEPATEKEAEEFAKKSGKGAGPAAGAGGGNNT